MSATSDFGIFVSYRREDAAGYAGRLHESLAGGFGQSRVFMDIESIEPGRDFVQAINDALVQCRVVVVLIGPQWLAAANPSGARRIDDVDDFVRRELEVALERGQLLMPVLVRGARMPKASELPASISLLARCQALELSDQLWRESVTALTDALRRALGADGDDVSGLPDPVRTPQSRERVGPVAPSVPVPLAVAAVTALTGRDEELAALRSVWAKACAPPAARPRPVLMVSGEPGIGKTRLVAELAESIAPAGGCVYYGRCDENSADPFLPWLAVLGGLIAEAPTEVLEGLRGDAAELQRLCPQIARRLDLPRAQVAGLESERARLFAAIERVVVSVSERAPILVVVDDLHWADRSSLLLLTHLASADVRGRFLLVGTYRDTELERTHSLSTALADLRRDRRLQRVTLRGLDLEATVSLIESRAGHAPDAALAAAVFAETEGHPFFVEEVCEYLLETGGAHVRDERLTAGEDLGQMGIPEGVRDVLGRRFERLSADAMETLRLGAVMGRVLDIGVLEELRPDADSVLDGIEEALHAGLVREGDDAFGTYEFCHALVRSTLVDEISSVRRVRLHRSIAETIERVRPELRPADLDLLAYHYAEAAADGDVTKAVEYACRAAEQATDRSAYDEANAYLERGLEVVALARRDAKAAHAELLIARAGLMNRIQPDNETRMGVSMAAVELARAVDSPTLFARAVRALGDRASPSRLDTKLMALVDEALHRLGDADLSLQVQLRARALYHRGIAGALLPGDHAQSRTLLDLARETGDWRALLEGLSGADAVLRGRPVSEREAIADELTKLLAEHPDLMLLAAVTVQVHAPMHLGLGDGAAFARDNEELRRLDAALRTHEYGAYAEIQAITDALIRGRFADADARIARFFENEPSRHGDAEFIAATSAQRFWIGAELGDHDTLAEMLPTLEAYAELFSVAVPMLAFAYARLGHHEAARTTLHTAAQDDFAKLARDTNWPVSLALLTEAAAIIGDNTFGSPLYSELEPYRGELLAFTAAVLGVGAADRYLALLHQAAGRTEEALSGFRAALEIEVRFPAPPLMARTQLWYGSALAALPDHRAEARRVLDECIETAASLGMHELANQAEAMRGA